MLLQVHGKLALDGLFLGCKVFNDSFFAVEVAIRRADRVLQTRPTSQTSAILVKRRKETAAAEKRGAHHCRLQRQTAVIEIPDRILRRAAVLSQSEQSERSVVFYRALKIGQMTFPRRSRTVPKPKALRSR